MYGEKRNYNLNRKRWEGTIYVIHRGTTIRGKGFNFFRCRFFVIIPHDGVQLQDAF